MAKKSMVLRDEKRKALVAKYAKRRSELKAIIYDMKAGNEERYQAQLELRSCRAIRAAAVFVTAVPSPAARVAITASSG